MFDRVQRNRQTVSQGKPVAPHSTGKQDLVCHNGAAAGLHGLNPAILDRKPGDLGVFKDLRAVGFGAFCQGHRHVERVHLSVGWYVKRPLYPPDIQPWPERPEFVIVDQPRFNSHPSGVILRTFQLIETHIAQRQVDRSILFVAGPLPGFLFQRAKQVGGVFAELGLGRAVAQLPDNSGSMPGRAGSQFLAFQQNRGHAAFGQMIKRGNAANPSTDNDDRCRLRKWFHAAFPFRSAR